MDANEIRKLLQTAPFRPFTIYMANDRAYTVRHPEFAWLTPNGRTLIVAPAPPESGVDMLDVPLIARIVAEGTPAA